MTTNKLVATLCGELFGLQVQAYPRYGSEKKGLPTTYYLTIAERADPPARRVAHASTSCRSRMPPRSSTAQPLAGLVDGGTIFLNTPAN